MKNFLRPTAGAPDPDVVPVQPRVRCARTDPGTGPRILGRLSATGGLDAIGRDNVLAAAPSVGQALTRALERARDPPDEDTSKEQK